MRISIGLLALTLSIPATLSSQSGHDARAPDERLVVFSENGFLRLAVTDTELRFRFTESGIRDMEQEIDADLADEKPLARWVASLVGETVTGVLAGLKVAVDVCMIDRVEYDGDHIVFERSEKKRHRDHGHSRIGPFAKDDANALIQELNAVRSGRCVS